MKGRPPADTLGTVNPVLDSDLVRHSLERVRESREFRRSPGLQSFLSYLVESTLRKDNGALKESIIGMEVFHRAPGYDTKADPIVRVQANRLRGKLERYYAAEGVQDLIRISLPSGAYVPVMERRSFEHQPVAGVSPAKPTRLLVLPLVNLTGGHEREFFSDGLTDELIHRLSSAPGLQVLAQTTALALKGKPLDVVRMRERFAVDVVIEGSVREASDHVRVSLRLIAAEDGVCIWSGQFERPLENARQLAEDVAAAVTRELRLRTADAKPAPSRMVSPAVHEAYMLGRYFLNRWRPEQSPDPAAYFRRAIQLDPTFAPAYCGLADCLHLQAYWAQAAPYEVMPEAVAAVEKALVLDPLLADAHRSLGTLHNAYHWDSTGCGHSLSRCLELEPGSAVGRNEYAAAFLTPLGRLDEARGWLLEAHELDPLSPRILLDLAANDWYCDRHEQAEANARKALELDPRYTLAYWVALAPLVALGRWVEVEEQIRLAQQSCPRIYTDVSEAWVKAKQGKVREARRLLEGLLCLRQREYCSDACLAFAALALGDREQAIHLLQEAVQARDPHLRRLGVTPLYRDLHNDPAWPGILRQAGLPQREVVTGR